MGRRERMKRGIGMKDRDERSRGIEMHIADAFAIIKPTVPFKLAKHEARRKRNWSDSTPSPLVTHLSRPIPRGLLFIMKE